jgi:hypothetical protein
MSDVAPVIGKSAEEVAYELFKTIASNEGKTLKAAVNLGSPSAPANADREWVLSTYAECLNVVRRAHYAKKD